MKTIPFIILFALITCITGTMYAQHPQDFTLNGRIKGSDQGKVYLYYEAPQGGRIKDSCELNNGRFTFKGKLANPQAASLEYRLPNVPAGWWRFFIEASTMIAESSITNLKALSVKGSSTEDENQQLQAHFAPIHAKSDSLNEVFNEKNLAYIEAKKSGKTEATLDSMKAVLEGLRDKLEPFGEQFESETLAFFKSHPQSYVTLDNLKYYIGRLSLDSLSGYYTALGSALQQTPAGKELASEIEKVKAGSAGSQAYNFSSIDIQGKSLSLGDFKGKYVLIDFWASWCVPCRKGNPHLKELYTHYKNKGAGFEIIGISDDDSDTTAWKTAVEKDGIGIWKHVLRGLKRTTDGNFDTSEDISEHYGIHTLPTKILIDPNGLIIGRYSSEEGPLDEKLAQAFNN